MIRLNTGVTTNILPDLTPLLDIIFIVMVFLLLSASVQLQSLDVQLPKIEKEAQLNNEIQKKQIMINIFSRKPYWALEGEKYVNWAEFKKALLSRVANKTTEGVLIGSDKSAHVQQLLQLFAFLQENKIQATQVLMQHGDS